MSQVVTAILCSHCGGSAPVRNPLTQHCVICAEFHSDYLQLHEQLSDIGSLTDFAKDLHELEAAHKRELSQLTREHKKELQDAEAVHATVLEEIRALQDTQESKYKHAMTQAMQARTFREAQALLSAALGVEPPPEEKLPPSLTTRPSALKDDLPV